MFEPGVNEELAATAVNGTQLVEQLPGRTRDGVTGFWYGKAPGLDRAADAIRHGNVSGTAHLGGAVALIGDDPICKSSTLPSSCELMAESLMLPLLSPGRRQRHRAPRAARGGAVSRSRPVDGDEDRLRRGRRRRAVTLGDLAGGIPQPPASSRGAPPMLLGASSVAAEHDLMGARLDAARDYGRAHRLNRIVFEPREPRRALVAPGPAFATLLRALAPAGHRRARARELGIRLVRLELVWPLHADDVRAFAGGVEELIVVEDKRPFVERQLRDLLYGTRGAPPVLGKRDGDGRALIELAGTVDADAVARALARHWATALPDAVARPREARRRQRIREAAADPAADGAHAVLLLGLPAQPVDAGRPRTSSSASASAATR